VIGEPWSSKAVQGKKLIFGSSGTNELWFMFHVYSVCMGMLSVCHMISYLHM